MELVITDEALDAIVDKAVNMKTGVRALRSLVKSMTGQARYDLAGDPDVLKVVTGPETLEDPTKYVATRRTSFKPGSTLAEAV